MKIITLCGSTQFKKQFNEINEILTINGDIVFSCGVWRKDLTSETKDMLNRIHKKKIDLSEEIFVVNVGGYIGNSTRSEIEYAKKQGKEIKYLEP